jgi:hypothetical protein
MKLPTSLICFTAFVVVSAAALPTPASAAKQSTVVAACKRTQGCWMGGGGAYGCSPNACWNCLKGKCHQVRQSDVEGKGSRTGIGTSVGNGSSTRDTSSKPTVNRGETAPAKFGATVNNPDTAKMKMGGKH